MKPIFLFLNSSCLFVEIDDKSSLSIKILPSVGRSNNPNKFKRVDFPQPDGPRIEIKP